MLINHDKKERVKRFVRKNTKVICPVVLMEELRFSIELIGLIDETKKEMSEFLADICHINTTFPGSGIQYERIQLENFIDTTRVHLINLKLESSGYTLLHSSITSIIERFLQRKETLEILDGYQDSLLAILQDAVKFCELDINVPEEMLSMAYESYEFVFRLDELLLMKQRIVDLAGLVSLLSPLHEDIAKADLIKLKVVSKLHNKIANEQQKISKFLNEINIESFGLKSRHNRQVLSYHVHQLIENMEILNKDDEVNASKQMNESLASQIHSYGFIGEPLFFHIGTMFDGYLDMLQEIYDRNHKILVDGLSLPRIEVQRFQVDMEYQKAAYENLMREVAEFVEAFHKSSLDLLTAEMKNWVDEQVVEHFGTLDSEYIENISSMTKRHFEQSLYHLKNLMDFIDPSSLMYHPDFMLAAKDENADPSKAESFFEVWKSMEVAIDSSGKIIYSILPLCSQEENLEAVDSMVLRVGMLSNQLEKKLEIWENAITFRWMRFALFYQDLLNWRDEAEHFIDRLDKSRKLWVHPDNMIPTVT